MDISTSTNQEFFPNDFFFFGDNSLFYDSFYNDPPKPNEVINTQLNEHQNIVNNFPIDDQFGNHFNIPSKNVSILKNEKKQELINPNVVFLVKRKKKLGRIPKSSTKTGVHTSAFQDNIYDKEWRLFFKYFIKSLNEYINQQYHGQFSKTPLNKTNVKKQFGSSIIRLKQFIKTKTYKVLTFVPPHNKKYKNHKDIGFKNEKIIRELVKNKKDELFTALMKLDIESIHNIFIQNKKKINIKGKVYDLSKFKILNDYIDKKAKKLKNNLKTEEEIKNETFLFREKFINLIKYIKEKIKNKTRKKKLDEKDIVIYRIIDELEETKLFKIQKIGE